MAEGARKADKPKRLGRFLKWTFWLGFLGTVVGLGLIAVAYAMIDVPNPNAEFQAETTTVYYADGKHELGTFELQNRTTVALSDVPDHVQDAVIAAENRSFWDDSGIDPVGILRAAYSNWTNDTTQGASTITQQYVKVLYLNQEQTYSRKIKEAFLAVKIERQMSKQEILQGYLNTIYFGRGAYGIEAAAQSYFEKPAKNLTVKEGAALAAILNSPGNLDPALGKNNKRELLGRYRYVVDGMVEEGMLPARKGDKVSKKLPKFPNIEITNRLGGPKGHLLKLVEKEMRKEGFSEDEIYGGGLEITTTFDWQAQQGLRRAIKEERPDYDAKGVKIGAASVEPGTGALRAMFGGPDYVNDQRNWALTGRQAGSSFKPYALAAGLEQDFELTDIFDGNTITIGDHTFHNEFDQEYGSISLETATEVSSNTAYIDLTNQLDNVGDDVVDSAVRAGIPKKTKGLNGDLVNTLGTADVTPVDMANGYATFANRGERANWYVIEKVTDQSGGKLFQHKVKTKRAYKTAVADTVNYALQEVVREGTGTAAQELDRPTAGKTGTATLNPETGAVTAAWYVGYTPQLATSVMYVRGKSGTKPLDGVAGEETFFGGEYPAQTWTTAMRYALQGEPVEQFIEPDELEAEPTYTPPPTTEEPSESPSESPSETPSDKPTKTPPGRPTKTPTESPSPSESPSPTIPTESPSESEEPTCNPNNPFCDDD